MKKEYKHYILIIIAVLSMVLITTKFTDLFGSDTDWVNQHTIFPEYFRQMFYQTGRLIPNLALNYGGGQNIFNLSYYGLLSPVILPSYLLPFMSMSTYMIITNIIIVIVTSILFYKWLKSHEIDDNVNIIASLCLALSACFIFQMHRHIMFVSYMPFLVMCLIGVDKLLKDNKKILLIIGIFLMIMTSYYYSVCGILVTGIYYLYQYLKNDNITFKKFSLDLLKFIGLILVGILLSAFFLLPTAYTMFGGRGEAKNAISLIQLFIPYLKIHTLFCGTYSIGLSMIGFISLLYLFFTKKKNNVITASLISIVLFIPIFRFLLNGGLYLREKCFIPFLPLIGMFVAFFLQDLFNNKINTKKFSIFLTIILVPLYFFNRKEICFLFALGFIVLLLLLNKKYTKYILAIYIVGFAFITCAVENYNEDTVSLDYYNEVLNKEDEKSINEVLLSDNSLYRSGSLKHPTKTVNKIFNKNYYTTSIYSSNYNYDYLYFVREVFKTSRADYNYFLISEPNDLLFNMFMGVKYVVSNYDPGLGYTKVNDVVYRNNNVLPMFYATSNILNEDEFDRYAYPLNLELLLNNVIVNGNSRNSNKSVTIKPVDLDYDVIQNNGVVYQEKKNEKELTVKNKGFIRLKLKEKLENKILFISISGLKSNSCKNDNISMKINNVENILTCRTWPYPNKNNIFRYMISDKEISELNISLSQGTYNIDDVKFYLLDYDNIKNIKENVTEFNISSIKNDKIMGDINIVDDSYFVTTLPYDKGFEVYVDGNKVNAEIVNKSFLGFPINKGKHEVQIVYKSPWFKEGKILTILGVISFGITIIYDFKKKK